MGLNEGEGPVNLFSLLSMYYQSYGGKKFAARQSVALFHGRRKIFEDCIDLRAGNMRISSSKPGPNFSDAHHHSLKVFIVLGPFNVFRQCNIVQRLSIESVLLVV